MDEQIRASGKGRVFGAAAVAGVAGLAWWLTRGAARDDAEVTYPPLDQPKPIAPDAWIVDSGPLKAMGLALPVRMAAVKLTDGGLLLHSPTRYSPALHEALTAFGPIRHLVAPNVAHWMFLRDWQQACPDATSWAVPALRKRAQVREAGVRIDMDLGERAPDAWGGAIEQGIIRGGGGFEEAWLFHKPSATLLLTDLIENLDPARLPPLSAAAMRASYATRATTAVHVRAALALGGRAARDAIRAMVATSPERVVFAHGDIFAEQGAEKLRRAFAWAL